MEMSVIYFRREAILLGATLPDPLPSPPPIPVINYWREPGINAHWSAMSIRAVIKM